MSKEEPIEQWEQFVDFINELSSFKKNDRWVFRGQRDASWSLETSLDRAIRKFTFSILDHRSAEKFLLREFQRHFHRYSQYIPRENDVIEWLSLMQHHGAPTRFLDWTYSAYVALYFAIESATENSECAVWAINQTCCWEIFKSKLSSADKDLIARNDKSLDVMSRVLLYEFPEPVICPLNPFYLNERLTIQQGTFLVPLGSDLSFFKNFNALIGTNPDCYKKINIKCSKTFLKQAFAELHRVNVSEINLFPGIDGLARSLRITMLLSHLHPKT